MTNNRYLVIDTIRRVYQGKTTAFVLNRTDGYRDQGIVVDHFKVLYEQGECPNGHELYEGVSHFFEGSVAYLDQLLNEHPYEKILLHFATEEVIKVLRKHQCLDRLIVFVHGIETERWRRRWFNFGEVSLEEALERDQLDEGKMAFLREIYQHPHIQCVFVSRWMQAIAEADTGVKVRNAHIIHNYIDGNKFPYVKKSPEKRRHILLIKSFASRKYGGDLAMSAILELAKHPVFKGLTFTIIGDGALWEAETEVLRAKKFPNVTFHRGFLTQEAIRQQHEKHGIFLSATRWDSQGVSMCEAMASGLVPVTHQVCGIPEFVDETCGKLCEGEAVTGLVAGILSLVHDPYAFLQMSQGAAKRMAIQCGVKQTISRELGLIKGES